MRAAIVAGILWAWCGHASAQTDCAGTFHERLADARQALMRISAMEDAHETPPTVASLQRFAAANLECEEPDRRERVALVFHDSEPRRFPLERLEVLCYGNTEPRCVTGRASIQAARRRAP